MVGLSTPALAAAVSRAGGLGSFGFAYSTPDEIWNSLAEARSINTESCQLNANFFIFNEIDDALVGHIGPQVLKHLKLYPHVDKQTYLPVTPYVPNLKNQMEPIWESRPAVLTFHFGIPPKSILNMAKEYNISVGITATTVQEAIAIESCGADFIVAQGVEAGGHFGCFETSTLFPALTPVAQLVHEIRTHVLTKKMLVVAAGGIMSGNDVCSALHPERGVGADVVQMGTAFLCTEECNAPIAYKDKLMSNSATQQDDTVLTKAFSGRFARAIGNDFTRRWGDKPTLPFPLQNTLTQGMRQKARTCHDSDFLSMYAGVHHRQCRDVSASELMGQVMQEYDECRRKQLIREETNQ